MDHNDYFEPEIAKQFSAFGVWNNDHSIVFHHKGSTFHRLSLGRSFSNSSLYLTLEETIFALLRTDFVLVDNNTKVFVTLTVHVYLAFQRFGKCPKPLKEVSNPEMRFFNPEPVLSISSLPKKRDKVELQSLLKVFQKNLTSQILDFKTSLPLPSFTVDNVQVFAAMPDSPAFSILETLNNFNCIVSVSNLESVYFLTLSPFKINT